MKNIIITLFTVFIFTSSNADELTNNISNARADLIPGEGTTEVSVDLKNHKPDYSILGVRELIRPIMEIFLHSSLYSIQKKITQKEQ